MRVIIGQDGERRLIAAQICNAAKRCLGHHAPFLSRCEAGATSIEYALIAALIAIAIISVTSTLGETLSDLFFKLADALESSSEPAPPILSDQPNSS